MVTTSPVTQVPPHPDAGSEKYGRENALLVGMKVCPMLPVPTLPTVSPVHENAVADVNRTVHVCSIALIGLSVSAVAIDVYVPAADEMLYVPIVAAIVLASITDATLVAVAV